MEINLALMHRSQLVSADLTRDVKGVSSTMESIDLPDGYDFVYVPQSGKDEENKMCLDINIKNRSEFNSWLGEISVKNNVAWRKDRGDNQRNGRLVVSLVCHHTKRGQKGVKITSTK